MNEKLSKLFLAFSMFFLLGTVVWLVYPSPYRLCHIFVTGMGRARLAPKTAKFKPYKGKVMGGLPLMAAAINEQIAFFTANNEPHCFLSLGAELSGTAEAFLTKGEAVCKTFSAMGLDAMLVGNIEFAFGKERLKELSKSNAFKFIASNIVESDSQKTPDYFFNELIVESPLDLKIGLIGLTPVDTPEVAAKDSISGLDFVKPDLVLKKRVESLRERGADIVALMTQYSKDYINADEWLAIASAAPDICFMLDTDLEPPVPFSKDGVIVYTISAYNQTKELDVLNLEITKKRPVKIVGISANRLAINKAEYDEDPVVRQVVEKATADINSKKDSFVGNFAADYSKSYYGECPFGNLVTDAMKLESGADIAMQNSGSIHSNISEGRFTLGDLYTVMPFDNKMVTMSLKGSDIIELLKISASRRRGVLQVSGLEYAYNYLSKSEHALKYVKMKGEDLVLDRLYTVVTSDFLADGGDGYIPFRRGENIVEYRSQREVVKDYIASVSAKVPVVLKTEGRIRVEE